VCTRPQERNGFGLDPAIADRVAARIEAGFHLLPETPEVYRLWRRLVVIHSVSGVKIYDARLVAAANAHGVGSILTFNEDDFRRYPGIEVLHPRALAQT